MWNSLWAAVKAIELAGTDDREAIAKATCSANLKWECPIGVMHISLDGESGLEYMLCRSERKGN